MQEAQETLSIESFLILLFSVALISFIAKRREFYKTTAGIDGPLFVTLFQFLAAFFLFFLVTTVVSAFGGVLIEKAALMVEFPLERYAVRLLSGLLMVFATTLALYFFATRNLFRQRAFFSLPAFFKGALSWFIAYPQMMLITIALNYILMEVFDLETEEQSSVLELRSAKSYPALFYLMILAITLVVPLCEEILFRGYLQNFLRRFLPRWPAILVTSLIFALFHFSESQSAGNLVILPSLFFFSLYLGFVFEKWGSLSASYGLHAFFNGMSSLMIGSSS